MTCHEFIDFLWAYLSGEVTEAQRAEFEFHLSGCPSCVAYMNTYRQTIEMGRAAFEDTDDPLPGDVPEELVQAILSARKPPQGS
jgi:anti-sigma factor RsiW